MGRAYAPAGPEGANRAEYGVSAAYTRRLLAMTLARLFAVLLLALVTLSRAALAQVSGDAARAEPPRSDAAAVAPAAPTVTPTAAPSALSENPAPERAAGEPSHAARAGRAPRAAHQPPPSAAIVPSTRRVYVGVFLHDLIRFDQKAGTFDTEFELWVKWNGDFEPDRVRISNAADIDRAELGHESDGTWHSARYRVRGTLRGEFPVHRFPFDSQSPTIELELDARDGTLVPDLTASGMRERFSISGWTYEPRFRGQRTVVRYASDLGSLAGEGERLVSQRAVFRLTLRRPLVTAALKFFLPLLIILLVASVAFFLPADRVDARASIGVTALLACFAFQFAVADSMPDVSYMTLADSIFLLSYFFTSIALVVSVIVFDADRRGRSGLAGRVDFAARILLPIFVVVPTLIVLKPPREETRHTVAPLPTRTGPRSSRPLLRVAATKLASATGGLASQGAYWTATHGERDEGPQPWLVEALPELDDDALRIAADGSLSVRWRLRADARWSDGALLTVRDVLFAQRASPAPEISSIESVSDREFIVHYRTRTTSALESFALMPQHALAASFADAGYDGVRARRRAGAEPSLGPYRIASFTAERSLVLEANPRFVGPAPAIPRVEVQVYRDGAAALAALERGEADITMPNVASSDEASEFAERHAGWVSVRTSRVLLYLQPDLTVPMLQSLDVRRAIALALDREALARDLFGATGRPAHAPWVGGVPRGGAPQRYAPDEARALLERAGALGAHLELRHATDAASRAQGERVAELLRAVGLDIALVAVRDLAEVHRARRHGGLLLYALDVDDTDHPLRWWNVPMQGRRYDASARNAAFDDEMAALVDRYSRTIYRERREALRERLAALASERLPLIPVVFASQRVVADPRLHGWDHGEASDFGEGIDRWYFTP